MVANKDQTRMERGYSVGKKTKKKNKDPTIPYTETQDDGTEVFVYGKNRIIVSEHFADNGKTLEDLIVDLILREARHNTANNANQ